jgi:hypothetical protein
MHRLLILVALAGPACGGGGSSPREACEDLVGVTCGKLYECLTETERATAGLPPNEAGCITEFEQTYGCANQTADTVCEPGETYHAARASACVDQIDALSCAAARGGSLEAQAPACSEVCTVE